MKIAVTGAAGRLGREVTLRLQAEGRDFVAIDRESRGGKSLAGDLRDPGFSHSALAGAEAIIHLAGNLDNDAGQQVFDDNSAMNANVFSSAAAHGVKKVVFASSIQVMGWRHSTDETPWGFQPAYLPLDEECPLRPATPYALSKTAGESLLRAYCDATAGSGLALRFPRLMTAAEYPAWSRKLSEDDILWVALSYYDAARLTCACLDLDLPGFHAYLPAGPDAPWGPSRRKFLERYYPAVPCRVPPEEMSGLVDGRKVTAGIGWAPLSWEEQIVAGH